MWDYICHVANITQRGLCVRKGAEQPSFEEFPFLSLYAFKNTIYCNTKT